MNYVKFLTLVGGVVLGEIVGNLSAEKIKTLTNKKEIKNSNKKES